MTQKVIITLLVIFIVFYGIRFFKKININNSSGPKKKDKVVDLEKDPKTNQYKPKE